MKTLAPRSAIPPRLSGAGWAVRTGAALALLAIASTGFAAGAPDIVWSGGGHTGVNAAAITPDGRTLATGSLYDETIKLWDSDGVLIRTINATFGGIFGIAVSPDGQFVASAADPVFGANEETVKLFSIADGSLVREFHGDLNVSYAVAFSPDGALLAAAKAYTIEIFNVADGTLLKTLRGHTFSVFGVAWSPDGQLLASASGDKTAKIWNVSTGAVLQTLRGHQSFVDTVAFSPSGKTLATGSYDSTVKLWNVATGALQRNLTGHTDIVASVAFAPSGLLASGSWDGTVRLWNTQSGALVGTLEDPSVQNVQSVSFTANGSTLYAGGLDSHTRKWRVQDRRLLLTIGHHTAPVTSVAYSPDGTTFASAAKDLTARIWKTTNGSELHTLTGPVDVLNGIGYSPDSHVLAAACGRPPPTTLDQRIYLWDTTTGEILQVLAGHSGGSTVVVIAPDGETVVSGGRDNTVKFWSLTTGQLIKTVPGQPEPLRAHLSADGQFVAFATSAGVINFRRLSDGAVVKTITSPQSNGLADFALSNDGNLLATAENGYGDNVKVFEVASGSLVRTLRGHTEGFAQAVAFSNNGATLASGSSYSREIIFWRVSDGRAFRRYDQETGWGLDPQLSIAFSPDGATFGYGRNDATVTIANRP